MFGKRKRTLAIFLVAASLFIAIMACGGSNESKPSGGAPQDDGEIIIPAGKLHEYADNYPTNQDVFVRKLDETTDTRPNDLEELCKDWLYYRKKIMDAENAGQTDKAADYRAQFQKVNAWLDEYNQSDVSAMFEILETQGYSPP